MNFKFDLKAGFLLKKSVRQQLENSKKKLEFQYPECSVLLTENNGRFHFEAKNIPDSEEYVIRNWLNRIKMIAD